MVRRLLAEGGGWHCRQAFFAPKRRKVSVRAAIKILEKDAGICFYIFSALTGMCCLKSEDGMWFLAF